MLFKNTRSFITEMSQKTEEDLRSAFEAINKERDEIIGHLASMFEKRHKGAMVDKNHHSIVVLVPDKNAKYGKPFMLPFFVNIDTSKVHDSYPHYDVKIFPGDMESSDWSKLMNSALSSHWSHVKPMMSSYHVSMDPEEIADEIYQDIEKYSKLHNLTPSSESFPSNVIMHTMQLWYPHFFDSIPPHNASSTMVWKKRFNADIKFPNANEDIVSCQVPCVAIFTISSSNPTSITVDFNVLNKNIISETFYKDTGEEVNKEKVKDFNSQLNSYFNDSRKKSRHHTIINIDDYFETIDKRRPDGTSFQAFKNDSDYARLLVLHAFDSATYKAPGQDNVKGIVQIAEADLAYMAERAFHNWHGGERPRSGGMNIKPDHDAEKRHRHERLQKANS